MSDRLAALSALYRVQESFAGGEALVYKAWDVQGDRWVAIRIPNEAIRSNPKWLERFVREAHDIQRLDHPNIRKILKFYEPGELDAGCYVICEWMDETLGDCVGRGPLDPATGIEVLKKILRGLQVIHGEGLVHRDVKPDNIFLSEDLRDVKVGDLGVAAAAGAQQTTRITPRYMAPEFFREGAHVDQRADLYSVGMICYEIFLGAEGAQRAFPEIFDGSADERAQEARWLNWHLDRSRAAPQLHTIAGSRVPEPFSRVVARLTAKDADDRYANVAAVLADLGEGGTGGPAAAPFALIDREEASKAGAAEEMPEKKRNRVGLLAVLVGGLALLGVLAYVFLVPGTSGDRAAAEAARRAATEARQRALDSGATDEDEPMVLGMEQGRKGTTWFEDGAYDEAVESYQIARAHFEEAIRPPPTTLPPPPPGPPPGVAWLGSTPEEIATAVDLCREAGAECAMQDYASETYRPVELTPFEIDAFEVTNEEFARFAEETGYVTEAERRGFSYEWIGPKSVKAPDESWRTPDGVGSSIEGLERHPVSHIAAADAEAYCSWAGGRLPTEDEWEYTARGAERRIFPWGDEWVDSAVKWRSEPDGGSVEVGSFASGKTPEGVYDLSGNVWEWTATSTSTGERILKGGSYAESNPANLRAAAQRVSDPGRSHADDGFRCVRDLEAWPEIATAQPMAPAEPRAQGPVEASPEPSAEPLPETEPARESVPEGESGVGTGPPDQPPAPGSP